MHRWEMVVSQGSHSTNLRCKHENAVFTKRNLGCCYPGAWATRAGGRCFVYNTLHDGRLMINHAAECLSKMKALVAKYDLDPDI